MQVFYVGDPLPGFLGDQWDATPLPLHNEPMFVVDALFAFPSRDYGAEAAGNYQLVARSGRPLIRVGAVSLPIDRMFGYGNTLMVARYDPGDSEQFKAWIADRPRTNYRSVDCGIYDLLESVIVTRREIDLVFTRADGGDLHTHIGLQDMKTHRGEEYVQLTDTCWIRLDRLVSVDGRRLTGLLRP